MFNTFLDIFSRFGFFAAFTSTTEETSMRPHRPFTRGPLLSLLVLVAALALAGSAQAQLVINELDYDQPGTDTAAFIELKNVSRGSLNLDP